MVQCSKLLHCYSKAAGRHLLHMRLQQRLQLLNAGAAPQHLHHVLYLAAHIDWALQHMLLRGWVEGQQLMWHCWWLLLP
jgi:hypothetical protein